MGRFSLYKGRYPEVPNEIMLELNQMSNMNLDLEVGQNINVAITIQRASQDAREYVKKLNIYLLRTGFLIGIPGGFGIAALIIFGMNIIGGRILKFYVIPSLLTIGIIAGCLSLFVGMLITMRI